MIYKPTKTDLDRQIQSVAGEVQAKMMRWKFFYERILSLTDHELTTIGYSGTEITYIRSFSVALANIELLYRKQTPLNSDDPSYFIAQMSPMIIT